MSAQSYGPVEFKVTTEALKTQAGEVTRRIERVVQCFEELAQTIRGTHSYWIGEAGNLYRRSYEERKDDLNEMFNRLKEHPKDLLQIAGIYEEGEQKVTESFSALQTNAIS